MKDPTSHTSLPELFRETRSLAAKTLVDTNGADDPLAILFRASLEEQEAGLDKLADLLEEEEPKLEQVKKYTAISYNCHEVAHAKIRAWTRMLEWTGKGDKARGEEALSDSKAIKARLERAAVLLEERFGYEDIKYVVPAFYNPALR